MPQKTLCTMDGALGFGYTARPSGGRSLPVQVFYPYALMLVMTPSLSTLTM